MLEQSGHIEPARGATRAILLLGTATFLFWAALYLFVPVLPLHAESLGAGLPMVGAVIASYAVAQLLLRIPIGIGTDLLGRRKPFVVAGLLIASVGAVVMAFAPGAWSLLTGRTITGIAAATWVATSILFASYFPPEHSARGIGIISFVSHIAVVFATYVGGQVADLWGYRAAFLGGAALGVIGIVFLAPVAEPFVVRSRTQSWRALLKVAVHPLLLLVSVISIFIHFANSATIFSFTLVYADRLGASSSDLGLISAANLGTAALSTLVTVYLVERWGYSFAISVGAALMGTALLVTPHVADLWLFGGLQIAAGAGRGLASTSLMAASISAVQPDYRATAMGVYQAVYSIGMLTGPILGGVAADGLGIGSAFYLSGSLTLLAGGMAYLRKIPRH